MLAYIALFTILSVGLVALVIWQYIAFGTSNPPYLKPGDLFFTSGQNLLLQFLNVIEFIWGIQFLRDSCNLYHIQSTTSFREIPSSGISLSTTTLKHKFLDPSNDSSSTTLAA
jgi:hypothetical protein